MHQIFEILESTILNKLNPSNINILESSDDSILKDCLFIVSTEVPKIKSRLFKVVFDLRDDKLIGFYVQNHQKRLVFLTDKLFDFIQSAKNQINTSKNIEIPYINTCETISLSLEELLSFIESNFEMYFNSHEKIPNCLKQKSILKLKANLKAIEKLSTSNSDELFKIATDPFREFIEGKQEATFHQLRYLLELFNQLSCFKSTDSEVEYEEFLKLKLFYLNFNTMAFFHYLTIEVLSSIEIIESISLRIEKLYWYLKVFNQTPIGTRFVFNTCHKAINDNISEWLIEEIAYNEKCIQLAVLNKQELKSLVGQNFKISTDLSVAQFAYLLRVLVEVGVFKNQNDLEFTRFFAVNTKSKRTDNISPESLRTKFYSIDCQLSDDIKEIAIKMLNYIQKNQ